MVKRIIFAISMTLCLLIQPYKTWAGPAQEIEAREAAESMEATIVKEHIVVKYSNAETGIYQWPDETSMILGTALINTSFEVAAEENGWSLITTQDGYAFIKSEFLVSEEIPAKAAYQYTNEDLYIMAHLLAGEAQNCSDEEQLYVGSVALNRIEHPEFPNTLKGVVFQRGQYACTWDGNYYREPTERNWENAKKLLEGGSVLPSDVIWQSSRRQGKGTYLKTRWHYYCF